MTKLKIFALAGVAAMTLSTAAYAGGNDVIIVQNGVYNSAYASQDGRNNQAIVDQSGYANETYVRQTGRDNGAGIAQSGTFNEVHVVQRRGYSFLRHRRW